MELKHGDITAKIIAAAMEVYNRPGYGFPERIYQRALEVECRIRRIPAISEYELPVFYKQEQAGTRSMDFLVENNILVELKAISDLTPANFFQAKNYPETHNLEIGLLINFGAPGLQFKRLHNKRYLPAIDK